MVFRSRSCILVYDHKILLLKLNCKGWYIDKGKLKGIIIRSAPKYKKEYGL